MKQNYLPQKWCRSLEQRCEIEFNKLRASAFQNALLEKTTIQGLVVKEFYL
jgi:hypothetical protein